MVKSKKSKKVSEPRSEAMDEEPAEVPQDPVEIEYNQPITSPYEHPIATVLIGTKRYGIPVYYLQSVPQLKRHLDRSPGAQVVLSDVDEDIGHTLIHFLYTGRYETLDSGRNLAREYRRSALAYQVAKRYGLLGLEAAATKHIEHFGASVHLQDVLETAREVFPDLPTDEMWFKDYLKRYFASSFNRYRHFFQQEELFNAIGQSTSFDRTIMQLTVNILFARISELEETVERDAERAPATEPESRPELYPVPDSEHLSEPESRLGPEPEPEYRLDRPTTVGDSPDIPPAEEEEVVDVGFSEEDAPIPEPEISDASGYTAEGPLDGVHQAAPSSPRPEYPGEIYDDSVVPPRPPSPVEVSPVAGPAPKPEESDFHDTWGGFSPKRHKKEKKNSKKKKNTGSLVVRKEAQPPLVPVDWR
ncbi:hypothetical protein BDW66DRAFT_136605 [Aspergillus desertorum]